MFKKKEKNNHFDLSGLGTSIIAQSILPFEFSSCKVQLTGSNLLSSNIKWKISLNNNIAVMGNRLVVAKD